MPDIIKATTPVSVRLTDQNHYNGCIINRSLDPYVDGYGIYFFTRPQLFIYPETVDMPSQTAGADSFNASNPAGDTTLKSFARKNMAGDGLFVNFMDSTKPNKSDKLTVRQLSYFYGANSSELEGGGNFLPILTNLGIGFDPKDTQLESTEMFDTRDGYNFKIPTTIVNSLAADVFNITVNETANMDVTKLISLWVMYIYNISKGIFSANPVMINKAMLDYTSSLYYIALKPDFRTVTYYAKYTGVFPLGIPYSSFKYSKAGHDHVELPLTFGYSYKEDMNVRILEDFNRLSMDYRMTISEQSGDDIFLTTAVSSSTVTTGTTTVTTTNKQYDVNSMKIFDRELLGNQFGDKMNDRPYVYTEPTLADGGGNQLNLFLPYQRFDIFAETPMSPGRVVKDANGQDIIPTEITDRFDARYNTYPNANDIPVPYNNYVEPPYKTPEKETVGSGSASQIKASPPPVFRVEPEIGTK